MPSFNCQCYARNIRAFFLSYLQITSASRSCPLYDLPFCEVLEGYYSCTFICVASYTDAVHSRSVLISDKCISHLHCLPTLLTIKLNFLHTDYSPPIQSVVQYLEKERESHLHKSLRIFHYSVYDADRL